MATVLEECITEEQRSVVCVFYGQEDSMQRMLIKKCFLFTVESVCGVKRFTIGCQTFPWWRGGWNGGAEVAETTVKRLLCCGFRRTGKAMGQMYQCWWRICREKNVYSRFEYHMFYVVLFHLWPIYWLSLVFYDVFRPYEANIRNVWSSNYYTALLSLHCA
jgi:hypothetical protein